MRKPVRLRKPQRIFALSIAGVLLFAFIALCFRPLTFKTDQLRYPRVRTAYDEKEDTLLKSALNKGFESLNNDMLLVGLKQEKKLQVWIKKRTSDKYQLFRTYDFCVLSGQLGPKRCEGDLQVPEGFYHINYFNPASNFLLSLKVNYPNASDRILSDKNSPGGDIFIHGSCVSIGCIPITDDKIKELYVLAVEAKNGGQNHIPVYLFPARLNDEKFAALKQQYGTTDSVLVSFWSNLQEGYQHFMQHHTEIDFRVDSQGRYIYQ